jgi:hypothetical protein
MAQLKREPCIEINRSTAKKSACREGRMNGLANMLLRMCLTVSAVIFGVPVANAAVSLLPLCSWPVESTGQGFLNVATQDTNTTYWFMPIDIRHWKSVRLHGPAIRQAQIEDWVDDLVGFPLGKVEDALTEWRQSESRRPTPADIRKIITRYAPMPRTEAYHQLWPDDPRTLDEIADNRRALACRWDEVRQAVARGMAAASIQAGSS